MLDCKVQIKLYRSLIKHGYDNHTFEIIEECTEDLLNNLLFSHIGIHPI